MGAAHRAWGGRRGTRRGLGKGERACQGATRRAREGRLGIRRGLGWGGRGTAGEEALDGSHEGVEWGAGVALAEVGGGQTADEAVDAEATHGLVTQAQACVWITAHDEAPPADDVALVVNGEDARPEGFASAAGEDAEVVT